MDRKNTRGWLVVSVDVPAECGSTDHVHRTIRALRPLLGQHAIPVTWALDDLSTPLAAVVLDERDTHEVALRADAEWSSADATRRTFYRGFQDRVQQASVAQVSYSSIVSPYAQSPGHLDLLGKFGIDAVQTSPEPRGRWNLKSPVIEPEALRFGLWQVPVAVDICRDGVRAARSAIRRATKSGATVVIRIDAGQVEARAVEGLVRVAAQAASSGRLQAQTLAASVARLARRRQTTPSQSILRAA